jgi:hypothetical protein
VIAYGEANVAGVGFAGGFGVSGMTVTGNFLLNPLGGSPDSRGQDVLATFVMGKVNVVQNNYALSSTNTTKYKFAENQEDSINFENGTGLTVTNNYVTGGHSASGCGIIADVGGNGAQFTLQQSGQHQPVRYWYCQWHQSVGGPQQDFRERPNKWRRKHGHIRVEPTLATMRPSDRLQQHRGLQIKQRQL